MEGWTFEMGDNSDGQNVMVINQTLANRYWPNQSPLGVEVMSWGVTPRSSSAAAAM
jgi:hypothetical protein